MNRYAQVQLHVTHHAHGQYCDRVEKISRLELTEQCLVQLQEENYDYDKDWFIHLGGVWWIYAISENVMTLVTCYGKTTMDIPKGLKWASRKQDRLDLYNVL